MRNKLLILIFLSCFSLVAQVDFIEDSVQNDYEYVDYGIETRADRKFDDTLSSKYNSSDFKYKEEKEKKKKPPKKKKKDNKRGLSFLSSLVSFLSNIFPYLLALIVVIIIVKSVLADHKDFWRFKSKKITKAPIVAIQEEEEDLHSTNFNQLLKKSIENKEYRKATRYYYLILIKKLDQKELIQYHKDKTNSEYVFDLKNEAFRKEFAYLLYIYDYVWYGEFEVNEANFKTIENQYQNFINKL